MIYVQYCFMSVTIFKSIYNKKQLATLFCIWRQNSHAHKFYMSDSFSTRAMQWIYKNINGYARKTVLYLRRVQQRCRVIFKVRSNRGHFFWVLIVLLLFRPDSSNLPCLYSTFHLEYPLVLSRFCFAIQVTLSEVTS